MILVQQRVASAMNGETWITVHRCETAAEVAATIAGLVNRRKVKRSDIREKSE